MLPLPLERREEFSPHRTLSVALLFPHGGLGKALVSSVRRDCPAELVCVVVVAFLTLSWRTGSSLEHSPVTIPAPFVLLSPRRVVASEGQNKDRGDWRIFQDHGKEKVVPLQCIILEETPSVWERMGKSLFNLLPHLCWNFLGPQLCQGLCQWCLKHKRDCGHHRVMFLV